MIESLAKIVSHFPGATNRARCTAHIVNLVSKMILRQFDVRKKTTKKPTKKSPEKANETDDIPTNTTKGPEPDEDDRIADDLDREEQEAGDDEEDDDDELNKDVLTDLEEIEEAMKEEVSEVAKLVKPVRQVLFKVRLSLPLNFITFVTLLLHLLIYFYVQLRKLAYAMKRSTTILLPRWKEILEEIAAAEIANPSNKKPLPVRIMPRDVSTRWNSTYEMLKFAYLYREAIDKITGERALKLRDYELLESEWETVKQLRDSLKVCIHCHYWTTNTNLIIY